MGMMSIPIVYPKWNRIELYNSIISITIRMISFYELCAYLLTFADGGIFIVSFMYTAHYLY